MLTHRYSLRSIALSALLALVLATGVFLATSDVAWAQEETTTTVAEDATTTTVAEDRRPRKTIRVVPRPRPRTTRRMAIGAGATETIRTATVPGMKRPAPRNRAHCEGGAMPHPHLVGRAAAVVLVSIR